MKKILVLLICVFLLLTTVGCSKIPSDQLQETENEESTSFEGENPASEDPKSLYEDIVFVYSALLSMKQKGEELPALERDGMSLSEIAVSEAIYGIVDSCKSEKAAENLGYAYKDLDGNKIPELLILSKYTSIRAIFTISDGAPILLEANYDSGSSFVFAEENRFFMSRSSTEDNIEETVFYTCRVAGDKMVYDSVYGKVYDRDKKETIEIFKTVNGNRIPIDEDEFDELYREQKKTTTPDYNATAKLLAPRIYLPLKDGATNDNLPIADFSSYDAVRDTYNKISVCLDKFESGKWNSGEYDNLFSFPSDLSFEYYKRLLYAAYHGARNVGYDEIDLDGDGTDELVLINEDYRIKAIFTQKDGVPVLLDAFANETCWLDDKGFIHVDDERYYELEYSLYELGGNGKYNLIYSILLAENGNRYLTRNGKTEKITFEQSLELYDEYCCYGEPFQPGEYTRNVTDLSYNRLTDSDKDVIKAATEQTWQKYASLEETSNKEFARSNTYLSFESIADTQMTLSLKYVFTFSYPDPNKDGYLLDESTESTLKISARLENGVLVFEQHGIKGKLEFGQDILWLIIEESTDQRFAVGNHCFEQDSPGFDIT